MARSVVGRKFWVGPGTPICLQISTKSFIRDLNTHFEQAKHLKQAICAPPTAPPTVLRVYTRRVVSGITQKSGILHKEWDKKGKSGIEMAKVGLKRKKWD